MKKLIAIFALFTITILLSSFGLNEKPKHINWLNFEEAIALNAKNPKPIYFDMYTNWCGWCKQMDKKTLSDPEIIKYMNKNFYAVKFNAETRDTIKYKGKIYTNNRGYNELAIEMMNGQMSFPTSIFWNEKETHLTRIPGYLDAKEFDVIIHYYGSGAYFKQGWNQFKKTYKKANKEIEKIKKIARKEATIVAKKAYKKAYEKAYKKAYRKAEKATQKANSSKPITK